MARKVYEAVRDSRSAVVFYDFDYGEFVVKLFTDGVYDASADYFTDDRCDACGTADAMVEPVGV
jgi:hypothetical protein